MLSGAPGLRTLLERIAVDGHDRWLQHRTWPAREGFGAGRIEHIADVTAQQHTCMAARKAISSVVNLSLRPVLVTGN